MKESYVAEGVTRHGTLFLPSFFLRGSYSCANLAFFLPQVKFPPKFSAIFQSFRSFSIIYILIDKTFPLTFKANDSIPNLFTSSNS